MWNGSTEIPQGKLGSRIPKFIAMTKHSTISVLFPIHTLLKSLLTNLMLVMKSRKSQIQIHTTLISSMPNSIEPIHIRHLVLWVFQCSRTAKTITMWKSKIHRQSHAWRLPPFEQDKQTSLLGWVAFCIKSVEFDVRFAPTPKTILTFHHCQYNQFAINYHLSGFCDTFQIHVIT